jgi:hypothetical protein
LIFHPFPEPKFYRIQQAVSILPGDGRKSRSIIKTRKFDPTMLLNLVGGKSWRIYGKNVGVLPASIMCSMPLYKRVTMNKPEMPRAINRDVSSGTPSFGPKYFYGYGRTYFVNLYINLYQLIIYLTNQCECKQ